MTCTLCGLPSGDASFCCAGCENVYAILLESGVVNSGQNFRDTELFQQSLKLGLISASTGDTGQRPVPQDAETREAVFHIAGMWCTSCGWLIEHALTKVRGIAAAEVMFSSDLLKVRYCPQYVPRDRIEESVASLGYRATAYTGSSAPADAERKDLLLRTGIAAFLSMNVMMFSLVVYASYFEPITASYGRYIPFLLMALATPSVFYCAAPVLRVAWAGARAGVLRMESLLAMGILMAYGYSAVQSFRGDNRVYFDTVCAIVALVLTGKVIERSAKQRAARALTLLHRMMPGKVRLVQDGRERFVSVEALQPGSVFRVKSGERMPADGTVMEGRSHTDESVLTGESAPVAKTVGDSVVSGSINTGGVLEIRATRVGAESTLARIVRTVEQAAASRTRIERSVDRVARLFIPAVLGLAVTTFAIWQVGTGQPGTALMHAIAVLVIACPCALGIATPLALTAAVAAAGRRGILVGDTRVLETIRAVHMLILDKTGTATFGEFALVESAGDTSRMAELAAVEAWSEHPIAKALAGQTDGMLRATDVSVHAGHGITGTVNGTQYFLGNRALVDQLSTGSADYPHLSGSIVYFGWDGEVRGALSFGDRVRPEAAALCADLRRRGIRTMLLSGDTRDATAGIASQIGADEWTAEALPERKVTIIRELQQQGKVVAMIGDGVNDAPSLAQADLGIALGTGADIAMQAAPLVLMGRSLAAVTETLDLARRTFTIVRQNLFWAFAYNVVGISLAMAGILNPILAAAAMVLSSLSVIGNSRRLAKG
ncbi:MAG: heavy metal translocating P-type ATPase [Candidatus Solibacter sp.]|nr:heavy metal translocating P-type ATPase [Candidatus Solibacter sp.]